MAGRFSNTQYSDTMNSLLGTMKKALNNNYYKYSDKPPTPVEYFHINKDASMIDEGTQSVYNTVGDDSPFLYNRITNMIILGLDQMAITYNNDEYGLKSEPIEGEFIILPNIIIPYEDDQFIITYDKNKVIFKVTHVDPDTLENGANAYRIQFRQSTATREDLMKQVVEDFELIISNIGTNFNPVLKSSMVEYIRGMDTLITDLKLYYKQIFYNKRVQTFTFKYLESNFYDPYLIEFIRRNNLMDGDGEYIYIQHQTQLEPMFPMNYRKTMFNFLEQKDVRHVDAYRHRGAGKLITNKFDIFYSRMEEYYEMYYDYLEDYEFIKQVPCFRDEFIDHVMKAEIFEVRLTFYNVILKYLYDRDITIDDLDSIEKINYENNPTLFYAIPCIIYCLEKSINKMMAIEHEKH